MIRVITTLILCLSPLVSQAQDWEALGPNSRVMRHEDGSKTYYRRTTGQNRLVKKNVGVDGRVRLITHYFIREDGNPTGCKIYDSQNALLFKVSYAYNISTGRLMAERMFSARKLDPKTGKPMCVSETRYTYDAQGNRSQPRVFTFVKGKMAEEMFGPSRTTLPDKVFEDQPDFINPKPNQ